ncbi:unnamed protein product [Rotaria sordida]|uniref:Uncharacterized protein n=1 Tax=Rotaria sordida TaxID=392033 RepID=A0A814U2L6_9BILA|nr:unnamed protein product [Rotaria sordida]
MLEVEFSGNYEDEQNVVNDISGEELAAEQNRQAANEKERKTRQAKVEKEREEARQKIRDKYNIQKKDDPSTTDKSQDPGKINDLITRINNANAKLEKINQSEPQDE